MDWVNAIAKINNKCKFQLFGRTRENLLHLYAQIPNFDPKKSGGMSEHAFNLFLNASGIFLTTQEIRTIKDNFPHQQGVNYMLFVAHLRNDITQKRLAAIDHTFAELTGYSQKANLQSMLNCVAINQHPHVRSMTKQADKARRDIEQGLRYWSENGDFLTHQQFTEYCKDVNATVPLERQEFFIDLLIMTFGLNGKGVSLERLTQMEITIFEKIRQRTHFRKDQGWQASNVFKHLDIEGKGVIDYLTFVGVLDRIGCKFTDGECKALFYKHTGGRNVLSYEQLCGLLFEMGSGIKDNPNVVFELSGTANGNITTHGMTKKLH